MESNTKKIVIISIAIPTVYLITLITAEIASEYTINMGLLATILAIIIITSVNFVFRKIDSSYMQMYIRNLTHITFAIFISALIFFHIIFIFIAFDMLSLVLIWFIILIIAVFYITIISVMPESKNKYVYPILCMGLILFSLAIFVDTLHEVIHLLRRM